MKHNLPQFAIFEDTLTSNGSYYFYNPIKEILAYDSKSLKIALKEIINLQSKGLCIAGYISYEASYYLNEKLEHLRSHNDGKLLHFIAFDSFSKKIPSVSDTNVSLDCMLDTNSYKDYQNKFNKVHQTLINGESYQINLTKNIEANCKFESSLLYAKLKKQQAVKYAAYLPFLNPDIISISPELFFKKEGENLIVKPMKGTARLTDDNVKNKQIYNKLKSCSKNKSENLIIVDLLRNDLSAIAKNHTVNVDQLFSIEEYNGILQMTSKISAKVDKNLFFSQILDNLFPCGSITGAPKKRTMERIKQIEQSNRGVYTGSIGYILPNNDMCFNVAIRTIQKYQNYLQIGVGGGVTVYSDVQSEWDEMDTKINFIKKIYKPNFSLIESIYYCNGFRNLDMHLERLKSTASRLFFEIDIYSIRDRLLNYSNRLNYSKEYKIRLVYDYDKTLVIESSQINTNVKVSIKLGICPERVDSTNKLFQYKTTHVSTRGFYAKMHDKYAAEVNNYELIYLNEKDNITETRFHNIVVEKDDKLYTPEPVDGALNGIAIKSLVLKDKLKYKKITLNDLKLADNIYLVNSVRGLIPATLEI